jgi:hypothetical protein
VKIHIVSTDGNIPTDRKPFTSIFDNHYAERFIRHLNDDDNLCAGCGADCINCRKAYGLNYEGNIAGVTRVPSELLYYIDNPASYLPSEFPAHDFLVAINVHEDILLTLPPKAKDAGARAVIVPVEDPDWLSKWARKRLSQVCAGLGLEFASPKPFCSLEAGPGQPHIKEFITHFRVGKPRLKVSVREGKVAGAKVLCSAPCGCTYFVAHNLKDAPIQPTSSLHQVVAKYWHSYPCTASMKMDYELGDTILHKGGFIHYQAVDEAVEEAVRESERIKSL